jgi:hypothetical protein
VRTTPIVHWHRVTKRHDAGAETCAPGGKHTLALRKTLPGILDHRPNTLQQDGHIIPRYLAGRQGLVFRQLNVLGDRCERYLFLGLFAGIFTYGQKLPRDFLTLVENDRILVT